MRVLLLFFCCLLTQTVFPKDEKLQLDKESWQNRVEKLDYTQEAKPEKEKVEEVKDPNLPDLPWLKYVAYFVVGILIIAALILILKNYRPVGKINPNQRIEAKTIEEAEENLPQVALDKIYQEALDASDFKQALRIKFLMTLQRMIDERMIVWKKRKTNEQYLREIADTNISSPFATIVNLFDDVWYGEIKLTALQYEGITASVDQLNSRIHSAEK